MRRNKRRVKSVDRKTGYWEFLQDHEGATGDQREPAEANPDMLAAEEANEDALEYRAIKLRAFEEAPLTRHERWILRYISVGHSEKETAEELGISHQSVSHAVVAAREKIFRTYTRLSLLFRLGVESESDKHNGGEGD